MQANNNLFTSISLSLLGLAIFIFSFWFYRRLALAEAQGLHYRFHWFFLIIYKFAGKLVVSLLIGAIGLGIAALGIKKGLVQH